MAYIARMPTKDRCSSYEGKLAWQDQLKLVPNLVGTLNPNLLNPTGRRGNDWVLK